MTGEIKPIAWDGVPEGVFRSHRWNKDITGIILPDIHVPAHDWRKLEMVFECAKDLTLDFSVQLGDLMDLSALGRWAEGQPGKVEGERLLDDFSSAGRLLDQWSEAVRANNEAARLYVLEGNHERRIHRFCDQVPFFKDLFRLPNMLSFDARRIQWVPSFSESKMLRFDWKDNAITTRVLGRNDWTMGDGVGYIHGWFCNLHHAKKHSERYGRSQPLIYGHTHDVQVYTSHAFGWPRPFAASLGHLRLADPDYITGSDRWQPAFAIVSQAADVPGVWDIQIIRIIEDAFGNSHFWCGGRRYTSRRIHG